MKKPPVYKQSNGLRQTCETRRRDSTGNKYLITHRHAV